MDQATIGGRPAAQPIVNDVAPPNVATQVIDNIPVKNQDGTTTAATAAQLRPAAGQAVDQKHSSHPVKASHQPAKLNSSWAAIVLAIMVAASLAAAAVIALR